MKHKRTAILFLALILTLSAFPLTVHAAAARNLDSASSWARDSITEALDKGFVPSEIQSDYTTPITRKHFAYLAVSYYEFITDNTFSDVLAKAGYTVQGRSHGKSLDTVFSDTQNNAIIVAAYALGVINGTKAPTDTEPGLFSPDSLLTREQAAVMVRNLLKALEADVSNTTSAGFTDINKASSWAVDSINFIRNAGVMSGTSTTPLTFSPKSQYTREQSIITFNNIDADRLIPKKEIVLTDEFNIQGATIGIAHEQLIALWGEPVRIINTPTDRKAIVDWLVYHNEDYTSFYLAGVSLDGRVGCMYTTVIDDLNFDAKKGNLCILNQETDPNNGNPYVWLVHYYDISYGALDRQSTANVEYLLFEVINAFRAVNGVKPLVWNDQLAAAAKSHSEDLRVNKLTGHIGSNGSSPQDRTRTAGYQDDFGYIGECVAYSYGLNAVKDWVNSPLHRAGMLSMVDGGIGISGTYITLNTGIPAQ